MTFSFDKEAKNYVLHATLQEQIARELIQKCMNDDISRILDLGAGSGNVAKNLSKFKIDYFLGIDNAKSMLLHHPRNLANIKYLELECKDFEKYDFGESFDLVISSSSLHWAINLESIFAKIASKSIKNVAFSFFTNKSLESLHNFLGSKSPLRSRDELMILLDSYFLGEFFTKEITQTFKHKNDLLKHLKYSGLLGGGDIPFRAKKKLRFEIPFLSLSYEVLFFVGKVDKVKQSKVKR